MLIEQRTTVPATFSDVWRIIQDIPTVAGCLPGAEDVRDEGDDVYAGRLRLRVGAISVALQGRVRVVEVDPAGTLTLRVEATDRRIGGAVNADAKVTVAHGGDGETDLEVRAEASILGRMGQFGQAVMRKKADQLLAQFVENLARAARGESPPTAAGTPAAQAPTSPVTSTARQPVQVPGASGSTTTTTGRRGSGLLGAGAVLTAVGLVLGIVAAWQHHVPLALLGLSVVVAGRSPAR